MTFDEWFATEFAEMFANTDTDPYQFEAAARYAWTAAQDDLKNRQAEAQRLAEQIAIRIGQAIDLNVTKMIEHLSLDLQNRIITELSAHYTFPEPKEVDIPEE